MTLEERKNMVFKCLTTGLNPTNGKELSDDEMKYELDSFVKQVAKKQKEIIANEFYGSSGMIIDKIEQAPSPFEE